MKTVGINARSVIGRSNNDEVSPNFFFVFSFKEQEHDPGPSLQVYNRNEKTER